MGWISALPWNQAPAEFREQACEQFPLCSSQQPGVRAGAQKLLVHGQEYLCVLKYSISFATEQLHSLTTSLAKVMQYLRRLASELNKPQARWREDQIRNKIQRWLAGQFLDQLIHYELQQQDGRWRLQFDFDQAAFHQLMEHRLGRTVLLTNRLDWTAEDSGLGLWRSARRGAGVSRTERWGLVGLGSDASLDRPQNSHPCVLLHAGHFAAAIRASCRPKKFGPICRWNNCSRSWTRSNSSCSCIRRKERRVRREPPMCCRNRLWFSKPYFRLWSWNHPSVVPNVGNTIRCF